MHVFNRKTLLHPCKRQATYISSSLIFSDFWHAVVKLNDAFPANIVKNKWFGKLYVVAMYHD